MCEVGIFKISQTSLRVADCKTRAPASRVAMPTEPLCPRGPLLYPGGSCQRDVHVPGRS